MHHANIIIGREDCKDLVFGILQKDLNFDIKANPDFLLVENESFGIDDARDFGEWIMGKPLLSEIKVSLIISKSITHEAQNALLKILEEPPAGTHIFINLESRGGLLPTFISRVNFLDISQNDLEENINASKFLNSKIKERFALIRTLAKKEDKNYMKELIKDLEKISHDNFMSDYSKSEIAKNILRAKIFASARGASPKMLLEWLACVV
jgi:DNA polymerase III delta prime subunit